MKKSLLIIASFLLLMAVGIYLGQSSIVKKMAGMVIQNEVTHGHINAVIDDNDSIEEEVYGVQLIIKGKVEKLENSFKRNSGVFSKMGELVYDVTPATINVEKVIYGDSPSSSTITLLQHGLLDDKNSNSHFVYPGDEVILLLVKTTDGYYWSYNFDEGIWKIKNGIVDSLTEKKVYSSFKKLDQNLFIDRIQHATMNKKKRLDTNYNE